MPLLWFHALNRYTASDLVDALLLGASPTPPSVKPNTALAEQVLDLGAPCVYAYLGNAHSQFGRNLVALPREKFSGAITPFDTGACVGKIVPVSGWGQSLKRDFVRSFTFSEITLEGQIHLHPGAASEALERYVAGTPPHQLTGPDRLWVWTGPDAPIWAGSRDWRDWTWEGRHVGQLSIGLGLSLWTCEVTMYDQIVTFLETQPDKQSAFESILPRYVHGGFSVLLERARALQVQP